MRTMINATLSFGAIFVPVGVAASASRQEIKFRTLHDDCGQPIKKRDFCPTCEEQLTSEDVVKGWEYAKNQFVQVDEEALDAMSTNRERMIDLVKFVGDHEVVPYMIDKSYWLTPNETLHQPYTLLSMFLMRNGLAAIGRAALWGKEYPVAVVSQDGPLMIHHLFCADEIRTGDEIAATIDLASSEDGLDMLKMWAKKHKLVGKLKQEDLVSESRVKAFDALTILAKGEELEAPEVTPVAAPTIDMMKVLKEMVK